MDEGTKKVAFNSMQYGETLKFNKGNEEFTRRVPLFSHFFVEVTGGADRVA